MKSPVDKLLGKNRQLTHSEMMKVTSHIQREQGGWIVNSIMVENVEVPFKYKRKKRYKSLAGAHVNMTYYPFSETVAGLDFEMMKVVRIRIA